VKQDGPALRPQEQLSQTQVAAARVGSRRTKSAFRLPAPVRGLAHAVALGFCTLVLSGLVISVWPRPFGYPTFVVRSGSMSPVIPTGSVAVAKNVSADSLRVGDVVAFRPADAAVEGPLLIHRIISIEEQDGQRVFRTKGDANGSPDPWELHLDGTGGKVVLAVPYVGYLLGLLSRPLVWVPLVFPPASFLAFGTLQRIWTPRRPAGARS